MSKGHAVLRHEFADYLNVGTIETPNYVLMGYGFTTLDENFGAQTEETKYVNDKVASTDVVSYTSNFAFTSHMIKSEEAIMALYKVGRDHLTGEDAEFEYVRVELWDPAMTGTGDNATAVENTFKARKFNVAAAVDSVSGESKQELSGTLNALGDPVDGTFNTSTKAFTPAS